MSLKLALASGSSFLAGVLYHKYESRKIDNFLVQKPGLPIFGTVSAASVAVLSPPMSEPAVPILPEKKSDLVPAEPPKGYSRVAEIMRFGFPGFDNIRSRK